MDLLVKAIYVDHSSLAFAWRVHAHGLPKLFTASINACAPAGS